MPRPDQPQKQQRGVAANMTDFARQTFAGQRVTTATESVQQVQSGGMDTTKTPGPIQYQNVFADLSNLASSTIKAYSAYDGAKQDEVYEKQQRELSQLGVTAAEEAWSPLTLAEKRQEILERHASEEALPKYETQQLNALDTNQANVGRLVTAKVVAEESAAAKARAAEMVENWTNQPDSVEVGFANDANAIPGGGAMTAPPGLVGEEPGQGTVNRPNVMEGTLEEAVGAAAQYAIMVEYGPEWDSLNPDVQERILKTYKTSFQAAIKARRDQLKLVERSANKTDADAAGDLNLAGAEFADVSEMAGNPEGTDIVLSDDSWQETEAYIEAPGAGLTMADKRARARTALKKITDGILADHSLTLEEKKLRIKAIQADGRWGMYLTEEELGLGLKETTQDFVTHVGESADSESARLIDMHKDGLTDQVAEDFRDRMLTQMGFSIDEPPSAGTPERQAFDKIIGASKRIKVAAAAALRARQSAAAGLEQISRGQKGGRLTDPNKVPDAIPGLSDVLAGAGDNLPSPDSYESNAAVLTKAGVTIASMPNANPAEMKQLVDWAKQSMTGTNKFAQREVALFVSTLLPHQRRQFLTKLTDWQAYQLRNATRIMHAKGGNLPTNDYFGEDALPMTKEKFEEWTNSDSDGTIKLDKDANEPLGEFAESLAELAGDELQGTDVESWVGVLFGDDASGDNLTAEKIAANPFLRDLYLKARAMSEKSGASMTDSVEVLLGQMKRAGYTGIGDGENLYIVHDPNQHLDPTQMENKGYSGSDKPDYLDRLTDSQLARPVSEERIASVAEAYGFEPEALAGATDEGELLRRITLAGINRKFAAMSDAEKTLIWQKQLASGGLSAQEIETKIKSLLAEGKSPEMRLNQIPPVTQWEFRSVLDQGDDRYGRTAKYLSSPEGGLPRDFTFKFVDAPFIPDDEGFDSASLFEGQHPPLLLSQKGQPLQGPLAPKSGDKPEPKPSLTLDEQRVMDEIKERTKQIERDQQAGTNSFDLLFDFFGAILAPSGPNAPGVTTEVTTGKGVAAAGTYYTDPTTGRKYAQ